MGVGATNKIRYRYPGTKFFEASQHDIFYGRKQETLELIQAIKAYDIFVVFADSGIGKTSLLNAGIIPELVQENILPIQFRFQDTGIAPLKVIVKKLSEYVSPANAPAPASEQKLWRLFKRCNFNGKLPLFVFDQFEEFFNHSKQSREECITEFADLLNEYLPDYIKEEMKQKFKEADPTEEELRYYTPARLKMLFLIRADKLKLLDDLSKKIPLILRNRFHLKPLNASQAEEAILEPAHLPQNGFASPGFDIQPAALKEISNYLKNDEGEVEGFQLQILTQELEKRIISRSEKGKAENGLLITEKELGGEAGLDSITKNYYTRQLGSIKDSHTRKKAVELIEDKLIVEDRRISLPEVLLIKEGYSRELLDYLLNTTRLIRIDNDRYVEISHDRLLPSILKSKQQREQNDKRRKYTLLSLGTFALILVIGVTIYVYNQNKKTQYKNALAKIATVNAFILQGEFDRAQSRLMQDSATFISLGLHDSASKLQQQINSLQTLHVLMNKGHALQQFADSLILLDNNLIPDSEDPRDLESFTTFYDAGQPLRQAFMTYKKGFFLADPTLSESENIPALLDDVSQKIQKSFTLSMNAVSCFLGAKRETQAKTVYRNADSLFAFTTANHISLDSADIAYFNSKKYLK